MRQKKLKDLQPLSIDEMLMVREQKIFNEDDDEKEFQTKLKGGKT